MVAPKAAELMAEATPIVFIKGGTEWHGGAGWYYFEEHYPEEGSVGAFESMREALEHAQSSGEPVRVSNVIDATGKRVTRLMLARLLSGEER